MFPTKNELLHAHQSIKPFIHKTPVLTCQSLNEIAGCELFFKCENFQKMGAFKMRGGTYAVQSLSDEEKAKGVATHSSGNFAQAVALAAKLHGIKAYIIMPSNAPKVKKRAVIGYGAEVIECEPTLVAREATCKAICEKTGASFLHPYNQFPVMLGQGTSAMELIEEVPNLDSIIAPVGGGGLISGTALAAKYFSPKTTIYAGEPFGADDTYRSLKKGEIIPMTNPQTIADGLRTTVGSLPFPIIQELVKEIIRVEEEEIVAALRLIWERMKIVIEASSAVPFAALLRKKEKFAGQKVGIIITGGNVDLGEVLKLFK